MSATMTPVGSSKARTLSLPTDSDGNNNPYAGYFTIKTEPLLCSSCGKIMEYVECDSHHIVVVWEEMDDEYLLRTAIELKQQEFNPQVVEYKPSMGKCIDFYIARSRKMFGDE